MSLRNIACAAALLLAGTISAHAGVAGTIADPASAMRARFAALQERFSHNQFNRPLSMSSRESADTVEGEIHAIVDHPFAIAGPALDTASEWCEVLILHLNTKYCAPVPGAGATVLRVSIGKKYDQPMDEAYRVDFTYRVFASTASYLQVRLSAPEGPLSTRDYNIILEATPADDGRTYIRLSYSYSFGIVGRLAMQAYLGTIGRGKVGFTVTGTDGDGRPVFVKGMRGVVERNTMRYYLAIESFLGSLSLPAPARMEQSLRDWYAATEGYARQLHEMERGEYLAMKHKEISRQQSEVLTKS